MLTDSGKTTWVSCIDQCNMVVCLFLCHSIWVLVCWFHPHVNCHVSRHRFNWALTGLEWPAIYWILSHTLNQYCLVIPIHLGRHIPLVQESWFHNHLLSGKNDIIASKCKVLRTLWIHFRKPLMWFMNIGLSGLQIQKFTALKLQTSLT